MVVEQERRDHVAVVTINRPEARNAINPEVTEAMTAVLDELEGDDAVRTVVITGAGNIAFSAGADLKVAARGEIALIPHPKYGFAGITTRDFPKPLIAAVNGAALAGGFEMVLACDLVIAADHATFGIPEVKRGLVAATGGLIRLPKRIPLALALELAMTGDSIDARRAYELGLVNHVVPSDQLIDEAVALAERIGENAPLAVRTSKQIMREALDLSEDEAWKRQRELGLAVFTHPDAIEGPTAFAEKRPPRWTSS